MALIVSFMPSLARYHLQGRMQICWSQGARVLHLAAKGETVGHLKGGGLGLFSPSLSLSGSMTRKQRELTQTFFGVLMCTQSFCKPKAASADGMFEG